MDAKSEANSFGFIFLFSSSPNFLIQFHRQFFDFIIFIILIKLINHLCFGYATGEWNGDANWVSEELGSERTTNRINCRAAAADVIASDDDAQASSLLQLGRN